MVKPKKMLDLYARSITKTGAGVEGFSVFAFRYLSFFSTSLGSSVTEAPPPPPSLHRGSYHRKHH